jgi:hypothetical protein
MIKRGKSWNHIKITPADIKTYDSIIGQKFGKLLVIEKTSEKQNGQKLYKCLCDCGKTKYASMYDLMHGRIKTCGCFEKKKDATGKKYGNLTVLERSGIRKGRGHKQKCLCECGKIVYAMLYDLEKGNVVSCGCHKNKNLKPAKETVRFFEGTSIGLITREKLCKNNTSGKTGVFYIAKKKRWQAVINIKGKQIRLGTYASYYDAVKARIEGEAKYFSPVIEKFQNNFNSVMCNIQNIRKNE